MTGCTRFQRFIDWRKVLPQALQLVLRKLRRQLADFPFVDGAVLGMGPRCQVSCRLKGGLGLARFPLR